MPIYNPPVSNGDPAGTAAAAVADHEAKANPHSQYLTLADLGDASIAVAIVVDQKAQGSPGGAFDAGAWRTRDLNTVVYPQDWLSLINNQISIDGVNHPGVYYFSWSAPAFYIQSHQSRLLRLADHVEWTGSSEYSSNELSDGFTNKSYGNAVVAITALATFEIQHRSSGNQSVNGLGVPCQFGNEIYTQLKVTKLS